MAMDVAGFSAAEADQLRQAMASKRSRERMEALRRRLYDGMAANEVVGEVADRIWEKLSAFASYGFPESHSVSFAYLVYASAWLKRYYPAAFCAALLNAQPMGFYSPHSLVQDARRHGVVVRTPDLAVSGAAATLEVEGAGPRPPAGKGAPPDTWGTGGPAVRIGLGAVRGIGTELAARIVAEREAQGPYTRPEDLVRRVPGLTVAQLEALATAGALGGFGLDRRRALWVAGALAGTGPDRLAGIVTGVDAPRLPGLDPMDEARADLWATGISPDGHPTRFVRDLLDRLGVTPSDRLVEQAPGARVTVGGVVTHRQRPATAGGTTFLNLEDEGGLLNIVVSKGCWAHHRQVVRSATALLVRGRLERVDGVTNVLAERIEALPIRSSLRSRDFR
jgi:error-prone DNA polymerase